VDPDSEPVREPTGGWPTIADYWPDAPHRMSPAPDYYDDTGRAEPPPSPPPGRVFAPAPPPRRARLRLLLGALAIVVLLGGGVLALGRVLMRDDGAAPITAGRDAVPPLSPAPIEAAPPSPPVSIAPEDPPPAPAGTSPSSKPKPKPTTAPAAALPFAAGTFELADNVAEINVTFASLGTDPVRVTVPDGSELEPRLSRDGSTVRLNAKDDGGNGTGRLDVRLNRRITWSLRMNGGAREQNFDLADGRLRRIDLNGGVATVVMALPVGSETLPIRMTGGVNTWTVTTARRVPVRVLLRDGGGQVVLNGDRTGALDRDTRLRDRRGDGGGLDIDAVAGLGTLIVASA
jgi:hypothetical protein